ncbi:hypothetical protein B5X24_HaOG206237 [Helicoverpa armigera]|nr:hypothetical protein B5X24_HaOG206237 [Helicoverpa armigera]
MLSGNVNGAVIDVLYGANLCALRKKDGGIRPIAVGCTYRRIAAKFGYAYYKETLAAKFQPLQLGFGSKGGCEAAVHALSTVIDIQLNYSIKTKF